MNGIEKLLAMMDATRFEVDGNPALVVEKGCGEPSFQPMEPVKDEPLAQDLPACSFHQDDLPIVNAIMPGGKTITLLKTMQTMVCENDCNYCCFRSGRDIHRTSLTPDEMAKAFFELYKKKFVEGLFLSSGIAGGGVRTQDRLLASAEVLRLKLGYRGYIHLKLMPGLEFSQVERAMQLADRVSINLEAPNTERLASLAPRKHFAEELLQTMRWVEQIRTTQPANRGWNGRWPSLTTQFVVGAVGESDLELLDTTAHLYKQVHLARAYYSGFGPIEDTPLENVPAINPWREHRLYQASFLLRDYGFDLEELPFSRDGQLPVEKDPKLSWAQENLSQCPLEINRASRQELLRVPGIGPITAQAILETRRKGKLHTLNDLRRLHIPVEKAAPFLLIDGHATPRQLSFF